MELDTIGIVDEKFSPSDRNAIKLFFESIEYKDQKYWVRLPWKMSPRVLSTNYRMAIGQFSSLMRNLPKAGKLQLYDKVIQDYLCQDFIEEVPNPSVRGGLSFLGTVIQLLSYLILGVRPIFWVRITGSFSLSLFSFFMWIL